MLLTLLFYIYRNKQHLAQVRTGEQWHLGYVLRASLPPFLSESMANSALLTGRALRLLAHTTAPVSLPSSLYVRLHQLLLPAELLASPPILTPQNFTPEQLKGRQAEDKAALSFAVSAEDDGLGALLTRSLPPASQLQCWRDPFPPPELPPVAGEGLLSARVRSLVQMYVDVCASAAPKLEPHTLVPSLCFLHVALFAPAAQPVADALYTPALERELANVAGWQHECVMTWQLLGSDDSLPLRLLDISVCVSVNDFFLILFLDRFFFAQTQITDSNIKALLLHHRHIPISIPCIHYDYFLLLPPS